MLGKVSFLGLSLTDIIAIFGVILLILIPMIASLKNWVLSIMNRHLKEKSIIEKINLGLDILLNNKKYMQDIITSESRILKEIAFINIAILFRKDISYENLILIIDLTNKGLCFYVPITGKIQLVENTEYKKIKARDIRLHLYLISGLLTISVFLLISLKPSLISKITFKVFSINLTSLQNIIISITLMLALYIAVFVLEILWLIRKNPYDSYKKIAKNPHNISCLAKQNIIIKKTN